jgi:O-antigen ligase
MIWLLGGYMWLFVHRPFEVWPWLGALQLERGYMLVMMLVWLVTPGKGFMPNRIHAALALFSIVLFTAWVLSPYADQPGCTDTVENYVKVTVFYVLVVTTIRDERSLRLLVLLFLGATALYMAHSLLEFINGKYQWRMGTRRMIGVDATFSDPNAFAATLLCTLPLALLFWNERHRVHGPLNLTSMPIPRILLVGYILGVVGCILLTGSRGGFLGLWLLTGVLLVLSARRKGQTILLAGMGGLVVFAILSVVLPEDLQNRYLTIIDSSRGPENARVSASGRLDGFLHGIRVWQEAPLLGHGPASFPYSTGRGGHAHNVYGQVLSELGAAGAVAFLLLVFCFLWNWREARRRNRALGWQARAPDFASGVARAIGVTVLMLLVLGWAGHNLYRYNWQWFAAFQAIALHCLRTRDAIAAFSPCAMEWMPAYGLSRG